MSKKYWSLANMWNKAISQTEEREIVPRDRLYASELGRSDIDIWLKMKGEKPSNPPNDRAKRKFHAGDLYEWFVLLVLKKCGILISNQQVVKTKMKGCVEVSGRLDFVVGGIPNYDEGQKKIDELIRELELPTLFYQVTRNFIDILKKEYPEGLDKKILEIKSTAVYGFEKVENTNKPLAGHDLQNFHYSRGLGIEGALCYISRDDLRMYEIPILPNDEKLLEKYENKVKRMSNFYLKDIRPEKEKNILFDKDSFKFTKNFNVEYSPFLEKIYGFKRPDEYSDKMAPIIARWNRVLTRIKGDKILTDDNKLAIKEMEEQGFEVDIIKKIIN